MEITITVYGRLRGTEVAAAHAEIREIFFLSADRRDFADAAARDAFATRWLDYYLTCEPGRVFLARRAEGGLVGYLTGCADSRAAALYRSIPHYALFEDLLETYPAHLHVNCRPEARNRGIGAALINGFLSGLAAEGVPGVHVVTRPWARNNHFYRRQGFGFEESRAAGDGGMLLFMGRRLATVPATGRSTPS
jgi:GNAT superfamily N-acetyltransferase